MVTKRQTRRKALLAIFIAGGMLNSQLPALSGPEEKESSGSFIKQLADYAPMKPELRAYYLLSLANSYLSGGDRDKVEAGFRPMLKNPNSSFRIYNFWRKALTGWVSRASSIDKRTNASSENIKLANEAINQAMTLADSSDEFVKLNLYYIASCLFKRAGNTDEMQKCNKIIEEVFQSCENGPVNGQQIEASTLILNSMAYGLLPVAMPRHKSQKLNAPAYTDQDFKKSEKLKLRAIAMVDRLASGNHVRRKAHRDLVLWYMALGKEDKAQEEKQILFGLVGVYNDSILYPQSQGCGNLVWWRKETIRAQYACGMG